MKRLILPLSAIAVGFTTMVGLYTNKQFESLTDDVVRIAYYRARSNEGVVDLGDLIYANGSTLMNVDWVSWEVNSDRYENWKTQVISNPELGKTAISNLGPTLVRQINSRLNYEAATSDFQFDERAFWNRQQGHINRYRLLIQTILTLEDTDLNYFMFTNSSKASSFEFNQFLESKGLVNSSLDGPSVGYSRYPGDLILLVKRTVEKRGDMSYRQGFEVALSFIETVESILPV